ncbi:MAG TPA: efflux transporter outer membrane subunit [Methylovirgula sp.]
MRSQGSGRLRARTPAGARQGRASPRIALHAAFVACAALSLAACNLGPSVDTSLPDDAGLPPSAHAGAAPGNRQHFVASLDIPGQWWVLFHSRALNALVETALRNNPDLAAAQAALLRARENALAERSGFFPQLNGGFNGTGGNVGNVAESPLASGSPAYTLLTPQVSVSYSPDVFGLRQQQVEALDATADVQLCQLEAAYLTLTSNVVVAAIEEASLRGQIAATKDIISTGQSNLDLLNKQRQAGQISDSDVLVQQAALAQVAQTLPQLEKRLAQQHDLLIALAGGFPNEAAGDSLTISTLRLPRDLPLSLPSQLVMQRPDIRAADANLHAAAADVGVAIAARLPVFNLSATYGNNSETLSALMSPQTAMWSVTGSVAEPLFDGFNLYHKEKAAQAAYSEAQARYRSTVVNAFRDVADVLYALDADARTYRASVAAANAARKSLDLTHKQLTAGQINSLALLNAQQTYLQASLVSVEAQAARYADTAALFQALGGGWWNRNDVSPAATASGPTSVQDYFVPAPPAIH